MLSEKDREWARGFTVSKENIEIFRQELIQAEENGSYRVYKKDIREMDDDEIKVAYSNMRNYLSDMRTHN